MSIGVRRELGAATYIIVTAIVASPSWSETPQPGRALRRGASTSAVLAGDLIVKFSQQPGTDGEDAPSGLDWGDRSPNGALADDFIGDGRPITAVRWWGSSLGAIELTEPTNTCSRAPTVAEGSYPFNSVGATTDGPIEPDLCDFFGDPQVASDVWSCYRASCSGAATASLCGSAYDTKMAVYEGCACPTSPSAIRCSDDACGGDIQSEASFAVTAGGAYLIRIGGFDGDQGEGTLTITCVESEPCTVRNGGFESGGVGGWVATTNSQPQSFPWTIGPAGTGTDFHTSSPLAGSFDIMNGFDGDAGLRYELYQEVTLPAGVPISLSTNHRIQYDSFGIPSSQPRELDITLRDTNNNLLAALYHQDVFLDGAPYTDLGWNTQVFDIRSFGGQVIRVHFEELIPEESTGPALIEFDEISLTCGAVNAAELSVASMTMPAASTATLEVLGDISDESTFGVTIVVELVPTDGATGSLEFTPAPPFDIVQLGDPWPDAGLFTSFDTNFNGTNSPVLNGSVDDSGALAAPVTFSGVLSGFPVVAGTGASGVWDVMLTTAVASSGWEGLTTTLIGGTITVVPTMTSIHEDYDSDRFISRSAARSTLGTSLDILRAHHKTVGANALSPVPELTMGPRRATRVRPSVRFRERLASERATEQSSNAAPDGWLISFHEALGIGAGPLPALGVYYCDTDVVQAQETSVPTCGEQPVDENVVILAKCCLVHSRPDSRNDLAPAAPSGFLDEPCLVYGISIQGVVGREFIDVAGECVETVTQRQAPADFWGWHATNNERAHSIGLQAALLSSATMLDRDWLYGPWKALSATCAAPNMSFELLTSEARGYADCNSNMTPDTCDTLEVGDFDSDGTVGLGDHAGHTICLAGPGAPPDALGAGCVDACRAAFDVDGDGDVDLRDTAQALANFGRD